MLRFAKRKKLEPHLCEADPIASDQTLPCSEFEYKGRVEDFYLYEEI